MDGTLLNVSCNEWTYYNDITSVWYASKNRRSSKIIKHEIESCKPDIIFVNGMYSWYFNLVPLLFCRSFKKIISVRGMLHPGALAQRAVKKKCYLFFWKYTGLYRRYWFHASDETEKKYIRLVFGNKTKIYIARNFPRHFVSRPIQKNKGSLRLISVALVSPVKNILLVLQALHNTAESITYDIYGSVKDEAYWQKCLKKTDVLHGNITVTYHGNLNPSKVEEALSASHVFILPSKSENFGHAIFESLSAGRPVITSCNTPWQLLQDAKAGINVDAENAAPITSAINFFTGMEQDEYNVWSISAAGYAAKALRVADIKEQYKKMFITG